MSTSVDEAIEATKDIISRQHEACFHFFSGKAFGKYQVVYLNSNENIKETLEKSSITSTNSALSILGSGDQFLNLITLGFKDIDTFDTNCLTEYYVFGIKYAMILKYNYHEYLNVMNTLVNKNTDLETITQIILDLLPYMDKKYRSYWSSIIKFNYKLQKNNPNHLNLIHMLFIQLDTSKLKNFNNYLVNENAFNKLKNEIGHINYSFKEANGLTYVGDPRQKYDYIHLSNIVDYFYKYENCIWSKPQLSAYIQERLNHLNEDGILMFKYCFLMSSRNYHIQHLITSCNLRTCELPFLETIPINVTDQPTSQGIMLAHKR